MTTQGIYKVMKLRVTRCTLIGNSIAIARELGHKANDTVLFDHYRALTTKDEAEIFSVLHRKQLKSFRLPVESTFVHPKVISQKSRFVK